MSVTYWEKSLAGELFTVETIVRVPNLIVSGNTKLGGTLLFNKVGSNEIEISSASAYGYDYAVWNKTKNTYRIFIDAIGKVSIGGNAGTAKLTVLETTEGNAWPAASFINTSSVGFGIEVIGGNAGNNTATFKNYTNTVVSYINGYGDLWAKKTITSNSGTSPTDIKHFRLSNTTDRFSFGLIGNETGNNAGSNLTLYSYDDSGTVLRRILYVHRPTGELTIDNNTTIQGNLSVLGAITGTYEHNHTLSSLSDVSPLSEPILGENGKILVTKDGYWIKDDITAYIPETDLSDYYTKTQSDSLFASIEHQENINNPHSTTLQQVLLAGNSSSIALNISNSISASSVIVNGSTISTIDNKLQIDKNTFVNGELSFDAIDAYLFDLKDVDPLLVNGSEGSVLKKVNGLWRAAALTSPDLSVYLTINDAEDTYVKKIGDYMTGKLVIEAIDTNLTLFRETAGILQEFCLDEIVIPIKIDNTGLELDINTSTFRITKDSQSIFKADISGTFLFGSNEIDSVYGNISIRNMLPYIQLSNSNSTAYGSNFRIYNLGNSTRLQVSNSDSFATSSTLIEFFGNTELTSYLDLKYGGSTKLRTTNTGVTIFDSLTVDTLVLDGIDIYKAQNGKLTVVGDISITGNYFYDIDKPLRLQYLNELEDVDLGVETSYDISVPFLLGSLTGNTAVQALSISQILSIANIVTGDVLESHTENTTIHITSSERTNWNALISNYSKIKDWDLLYINNTPTEIGLSNKTSSGAEIAAADMKYLFYFDNGIKRSIKTKYSDNSGSLNGKPGDEFRYSRALGFSNLNPDNILTRSLYDLGVVSSVSIGVPEDGAWQVETVDASFTYNQSRPAAQHYLHQFATKWYDNETDFSMWARVHDGFDQEWKPWVEFMHSGNTPYSIELYVTPTNTQLEDLQTEANWTGMLIPNAEVYIGDIDPSLNIGQRIVDDSYVYEVTPYGLRRFGNSLRYLRNLEDVEIPANYDGITIGQVLSYRGDGYWEPRALEISGLDYRGIIDPITGLVQDKDNAGSWTVINNADTENSNWFYISNGTGQVLIEGDTFDLSTRDWVVSNGTMWQLIPMAFAPTLDDVVKEANPSLAGYGNLGKGVTTGSVLFVGPMKVTSLADLYGGAKIANKYTLPTNTPSIGSIIVADSTTSSTWTSLEDIIDTSFKLEQVTLVTGDHEIAIDIDRSEIYLPANAASNITLTIIKDRVKPVVITLINDNISITVEVRYTTSGTPTKLIDMQPNTVIEVIPGVWELN